MRWKKDFSAVNYWLISLLVMLVLGVYGCAGHPVKIMPEGYVRPDILAAAWDKLVDVETIDARGVLKLEARDGQKNSQRIRFTAKAPDLLKVQWLTPWYTVAWQLLIIDREFWLSDSKNQITYHGDLGLGTKAGLCDQHNKWWTYIELMASWPQLFSKPPSMPMNVENRTGPGLGNLPVTHTQYLVAADGTIPAGKIIRFADGTEWHVAYEDFTITEEGGTFPQRLEILCPAAKLNLRFESPRLNQELKERIFIYQQKNFRLKEVDCHNFLIP
ncbi:MAG: hypothetical protein GWP07_03220 [Xanthomonadaceae bacterium]|nr:hypothetical protein [Xanthomonadaceae bacterium]